MGTASDTSAGRPIAAIVRVSLAILFALCAIAGTLIPLYFGAIKMITGDYPPGVIMLLFAGFVLSVTAALLFRRYQGQLAVLGVSLLTLLGIIWAIFEDGYGPKAFMLLLVVTAGFMAVLGFYNVFLKRRQPRTAG
jgi:glucose dehydrogenase